MPIWRIEIIGQFGDGTPSHFGEFLFGAINMENLSEFLKERDLKLFLSWGVNKKVEKRGAKSWMHFCLPIMAASKFACSYHRSVAFFISIC